MSDGFEIDPIGKKSKDEGEGFVIDPIPRPTPPPTGPDADTAWMSNERYYSTQVPGFLPSGPEAARLGIETGSTYLGGAVGARVAGPLGMRVGEGVGAFAGSLASETVDPTSSPFKTAGTAAAFTLATGAAASGATITLRKMLGKPHEAGQALIDNLAAHGEVPPAGAVLDGPFVKDAQSFGGGAFFVGRRVQDALTDAAAFTSQNAKAYVSSFQRYNDGAKKGFARADNLLRVSGLGDGRIVEVDSQAIKSLNTALEVWRREGMLDMFPAELGWLARFNPNIPMPKTIPLTVNEAAALESLLYNRARAIVATPSELATAADGAKLSSAMMDVASGVQAKIDEATNKAIQNNLLPVEYRKYMLQAKELWRVWKQGELMEDMLYKASKDLVSSSPKVQSSSLLNQLDQIVKRERDIGRELLSPEQKKSLRTYAIALGAAKESAGEGAFKITARAGQMVGWTAILGAAGGIHGGLAAVAPVALAPPALAFLFTNKQSNALMIRGLHASPGTAAGARITRELLTLLAANGYVPPEHVLEIKRQDTLSPETIPIPTAPGGGIRGQAPTGGGVDPFTMADSGLR
jgi:hypothetical protein